MADEFEMAAEDPCPPPRAAMFKVASSCLSETVARSSVPVMFVEVSDSFSRLRPANNWDGCRTSVNDRSTRRRFGHNANKGVKAVSLRGN